MLSSSFELRARLLPRGTRLCDVPPDAHGLSLRDWEELHWREMCAAAALVPLDEASLPKISTSRDNYGWRSLPGHRRFIGA